MVAKDMGFFVVLFTQRKSQLENPEFSAADQIYYAENLLDETKVLKKLRLMQQSQKEICAILSFIDPFVSYAARLSDILGLKTMSVKALAIMENKIKIRNQLKELSSSPFYAVFDPEIPQEPLIEKYQRFLPLILKPPASNGSKDVSLVNTRQELEEVLVSLRRKYPGTPILAEEYLDGPQYLIEVLVKNGEIYPIGVIEQELAEEEAFIVVGYKYPAGLEDLPYRKLLETVEAIIKQLGLKEGSCHLEMRYVHGEWKLIEINPRMSGGAMNIIIQSGTGINLIREIINLHADQPLQLIKTQKSHVYARYLTIDAYGKLLAVIGEDTAREIDGVVYVYVKPLEGRILTSPYSMGNRYACIIAAADSPDEAKEIAITAAKEIKFYIEAF